MSAHPWWQRPFRALAFITATCDTHGDPSLTKVLAREYSLVTLYDMAVHGIGGANIAMAALCLSAAFGKSVWVTWLNRNTWTHAWSGSASTSTTITGDAAQIIKALPSLWRDDESGDPA